MFDINGDGRYNRDLFVTARVVENAVEGVIGLFARAEAAKHLRSHNVGHIRKLLCLNISLVGGSERSDSRQENCIEMHVCIHCIVGEAYYVDCRFECRSSFGCLFCCTAM